MASLSSCQPPPPPSLPDQVLLDCLPIDCSSSDRLPLPIANFILECACIPHSPVLKCLRSHGLSLQVTQENHVVVVNSSDGSIVSPPLAASAVASRIWCDALCQHALPPGGAFLRMDVGGVVRAMCRACERCVAAGFGWLPEAFTAVVVMRPRCEEEKFYGEGAVVEVVLVAVAVAVAVGGVWRLS